MPQGGIKMRKWNGIITAAILILFLLHGIMGSFQLMGVSGTALKGIARLSVALIAVHALLSLWLTAETVRAVRRTGAPYIRQNLLFWARRVSGFALLILLVFHMTAFSKGGSGAYRLKWFGDAKLAAQILLVLTLAVHIGSNVLPSLITFGVRGQREKAGHILFALSVLLLFMAAAFVLYYIRWNRI